MGVGGRGKGGGGGKGGRGEGVHTSTNWSQTINVGMKGHANAEDKRFLGGPRACSPVFFRSLKIVNCCKLNTLKLSTSWG